MSELQHGDGAVPGSPGHNPPNQCADVVTRACNKCAIDLPITSFAFQCNGYLNTCKGCRGKAKRSHPGTCRQCQREFTGLKSALYCSRECYFESKRGPVDSYGRKCCTCDRYLPWDAFGISAAGYMGHVASCKKCVQGRPYGLSAQAQEEMLVAQNNRCFGCNVLFTEENNYAIDHCHTTLKVRALLCNSCNLGLGSLSTKERLARAEEYLRRHNARLGVTPPPLPD